jgi:hypothetical protein
MTVKDKCLISYLCRINLFSILGRHHCSTTNDCRRHRKLDHVGNHVLYKKRSVHNYSAIFRISVWYNQSLVTSTFIICWNLIIMKISLITRGFYVKKDLFCQIIVFSIRECTTNCIIHIDRSAREISTKSLSWSTKWRHWIWKKGLRWLLFNAKWAIYIYIMARTGHNSMGW